VDLFSSAQGLCQDDERHLVECARSGDIQALGQLYELYFPRVYRYVHARTGNATEAEDVTEEIFLRMLTAIGDFQWRRVPFAAWLFRIARNYVISYARRNGVRGNQSPLPEFMADPAPDPVALVETKLSFEEALHAARGLPHAQREVIWLRFAVGLSVSDTARVLGKREGNVKVLQHKAIAKLQKLLAFAESEREPADRRMSDEPAV
jgi:RNA polymerase sigma-70 factor (ECF subfamily)